MFAIATFDTETTGLIPEENGEFIPPRDYQRYDNCRMIQIAFVIVEITDGKISEYKVFNRIIKPDKFEVTEGVHGLTHEICMKGTELPVVLKEIDELLKNVELLIAHNYNFDIRILTSEIYRYTAITMDESFLPLLVKLNATSYFCTLRGLSTMFGDKLISLANLYKQIMGKDFDNKHNAEFDARALMDVFLKLYKTGTIELSV